jgi:hypothetical protein
MSKPLAEELTEFQTTLEFYRKQYAEDGMITSDEQAHLDVLEGKIKRLQSTISNANTGNGNGQALTAPGADPRQEGVLPTSKVIAGGNDPKTPTTVQLPPAVPSQPGAPTPPTPPTTPTPDTGPSQQGMHSDEVVRRRAGELPMAEEIAAGLERRLRAHPASAVIEDILAKNGLKTLSNRQPLTGSQLAARVRDARGRIPELEELLRNNPDWTDLADELHEANQTRNRANDARRELSRRQRINAGREARGLPPQTIGPEGAPPANPPANPTGSPTNEFKPAPTDTKGISQKTSNAVDDVIRDTAQLRREFTDIQKQLEKSPALADQAKLQESLQSKEKAIKSLEENFKNLGKALEALGIKDSTLKGTFEQAREKYRYSKGDATGDFAGEKLGNALISLVTSYMLFMEINHIFEAKTPKERWDRFVNLSRNLGHQAVAFAIVRVILGASGPALVITTFASWSGEQTDHTYAKEKKEIRETKARKMVEAILDDMGKNHPHSVELEVDGEWTINDHKLFELKLKEYEKKRKEDLAKALAPMLAIARAMGVEDGMAGQGLRLNFSAVEKLIVQEFDEPDLQADQKGELYKSYEAGAVESAAKRKAALQKAQEWGSQDGKAGKPVRMQEINTWPIVQTAGLKDDLVQTRAALQIELVGAYKKAFDAVTGNITGGEKVAIDKKEAALKKARELGLKDGKTGKQSQIEEIQKWPEVTQVEATSRGAFLADLIEAYKKAFDSVAPANSAPRAPNTVSGGELVARDKMAALLKRAAELGTKDGKTGKQSHLEELHKWPEVTELEKAAGLALHGQLVVAYTKAFNIAAPATPALLQRARELGQQDAKSGMALHMSEISKWPEVTKMETGVRQAVLAQLVEVYRKALATGG